MKNKVIGRRECHCLVARMKTKKHLDGFCFFELCFWCQVLKENISQKVECKQQSNEFLRSRNLMTNVLRIEPVVYSQIEAFGLHNETSFHKTFANGCEAVEFLLKVQEISNTNVNVFVKERKKRKKERKERKKKRKEYYRLSFLE
jgi:hypothetical protein